MHIGLVAVLVGVCLIPAAAYAQETLSADGRVFMFIPGESIQVIDVTKPNIPLDIATIPISSDEFTLVHLKVGDYLAIMGHDNILHMVDVSAPYNPEVVATLSFPIGHPSLPHIGDVDWIKIGDQAFLLLSTEDRIHVIDVSNPRSPSWSDSISNNDWRVDNLDNIQDTESFWAQGKPYVLAAGVDAAHIIEFSADGASAGASVIWEGKYGFESVHGMVDVDIIESEDGVYAIILGNSVLMVADITDPYHPVYIDTVKFNNTIDMDILETADATYALVMCIEKAHIVDLTDPLRPHKISTAPIKTGDIAGTESEDRLWTISISDDISALDITNPESPIPAYVQPGGYSYQPEAVQTAIIDGRLYALTASPTHSDIQITDITDPANPISVSAVEGGGTVYGLLHGPSDLAIVEIDSDMYAVVTNIYDSSVTIIDVSDPKLPIVKSNTKLPVLDAPTSVDTIKIGSSTYAAVTGLYEQGIRLMNITNPDSPHLEILIRDKQYDFEIPNPLRVDAVTINGAPYVLVANYFEGAIQIIDITDINYPVSAAVFSSNGMSALQDLKTIKIRDGTFAITASAYDSSITMVDITDPYSPTLASQVSRTDSGFEYLDTVQYLDVVNFGGRILVAATSYFDNSIQLIDITDPYSPASSFTAIQGRDGFEALIGPTDISAISYESGAYLVVADYFGNGIQIAEITPRHMLQAKSSISAGPEYSIPLAITTGVNSITIDNATYALTASPSNDVVQITDISVPKDPAFVSLIYHGSIYSELDGPVGVETGTISGTPYAFIMGLERDNIQIVDLSDPYHPISISWIRDGIGVLMETELTWANEIPYLVTVSRAADVMQIFDVRDPVNPTLVAAMPDLLPSVQGIGIVDTPTGTLAILYSFDQSIMHIIDITDPTNPDRITTVRDAPYLGRITDMDSVVFGDRILTAASNYRTDSLSILDITDPTNPTLLSTVQGNEGGHYMHGPEDLVVATIGDGIFVAVAHGNNSLQLSDITDPTNPVLSTAVGVLNDRVMYGITDAEVVTIGDNTYILFQTIDENLTVLLDASDPYAATSASFIPPLHHLSP